MSTIWNSVNELSRVNSNLQLAVAIAGVLTAILCVLSWVASDRLSKLEDMQKAALQNRIVAAESVAAEARKEADAVALQQRPRSLSSAEEETLIGLLRTNARGAVTITAVMSDPEAERFALQIYAAFRKAGWDPKGVNLAMMSPSPSGIFMKVKNSSPPLAHAVTIQKSLAAVRIEAPGAPNAKIEPTMVELVIGHKP